MKKVLSIILAFILVFSLVACGKKLPEGFDQKLYDYATAAYELVRDYNLGKISKTDAEQRADTIEDNVKALTVPEDFKTEGSKTLYKSIRDLVATEMGYFSWKVVSGGSTVDIEESLKKLIDGK